MESLLAPSVVQLLASAISIRRHRVSGKTREKAAHNLNEPFHLFKNDSRIDVRLNKGSELLNLAQHMA